MPPAILAAFHDPGGFAMALPVLERLQTEKFPLKLYLGSAVARKAAAAGLNFQPLRSALTAEEAEDLVTTEKFSAALTGTSWGSNAEQRIRNALASRQIRSVVLLDYWASYLERWQGASYPVPHVRDTVCVIDVGMRDDLLQSGFPADRLRITGHPYWEKLSGTECRRSRPRPGARSVFFLSEPFREAGPDRRPERFREVHDALERLSRESGQAFIVTLFRHPKETDRETPPSSPDVQWIEASGQDRAPEETADWVIGYQTMGLIEQAVLGARVFAVPFIDLRPSFAAALKEAGVVLLEPNAVYPALRSALNEPPPVRGRTSVGATDCVLKTLRS